MPLPPPEDHPQTGDDQTETSLLWKSIHEALSSLPVKPAGLSSQVMTAIRSQPTQRTQRSVAASHRLAATVASLTALLVLSVSLSGLLDKPSQQIAVASAELYDRVMGVQPQDWDVVVVAVPESQQATMRNRIRSSVLLSGMEVASVGRKTRVSHHAQPDLLISDADSSQDVLNLLREEMSGMDASFEAVEADELDRAELMSRFTESMQSPTRSERHFGEMLIVHRKAQDLSVETAQFAPGTTNQQQAAILPTERKSVPELRRRPTLVVLTTQKAVLPGPQGFRSPAPSGPDVI